MTKKIAIIGGGWNGTQTALTLKEKDPSCEVTVFEKSFDIFTGISGQFGIRLHVGPHYPRSPATRAACREGFEEFIARYPELVNHHSYSVYALGTTDAEGKASKVDKETFKKVCNEFSGLEESGPSYEIQATDWGYHDLDYAANISGEPSLVLGERLRSFFNERLKDANVKLFCGFNVTSVRRDSDQHVIMGQQEGDDKQHGPFDYVINATSYQSLIPTSGELPAKLEIAYQPCLALVYEHIERPLPEKPFSFIVMDGWFPCLMPYDDRPDKSDKNEVPDELVVSKFIMTHGKWTIAGSYPTVAAAQRRLADINDQFIEKYVKPNCEKEMNRFWPGFTTTTFASAQERVSAVDPALPDEQVKEHVTQFNTPSPRFSYSGKWLGSVLAKPVTNREFRDAIVFQDKTTGVIYIVPGKVNNIFQVAREVLSLVEMDQKEISEEGNYRYVAEGELSRSRSEIAEKPPEDCLRNTCHLQPYRDEKGQQRCGLSSFWKQPSQQPDFCQYEKSDAPAPRTLQHGHS